MKKTRKSIALLVILTMVVSMMPVFATVSAEDTFDNGKIFFVESVSLDELNTAISKAESVYNAMDFAGQQVTADEGAYNGIKQVLGVTIEDAKKLLGPADGDGKVPVPRALVREWWWETDDTNKTNAFTNAVTTMTNMLNNYSQVTNVEIFNNWRKLLDLQTSFTEFKNGMSADVYTEGAIANAQTVADQIELAIAYGRPVNNNSGKLLPDGDQIRQGLPSDMVKYVNEMFLPLVRSMLKSDARIPQSQMSVVGMPEERGLFDDNLFTLSEIWQGINKNPDDPANSRIIDLGGVYNIGAIEIITTGNNSTTMDQYTISTSVDNVEYGSEYTFTATQWSGAQSGAWGNGHPMRNVNSIPSSAVRYIKITDVMNYNNPEAGFTELNVYRENFLDVAGLAVRAFDGFNTGNGQMVKDVTASDEAHGWASGWKADTAFLTDVDESLTFQNGAMRGDGKGSGVFPYQTYRKLTSPIDFSIEGDYYFFLTYQPNDHYGGRGVHLQMGPDLTFVAPSGDKTQLTSGSTTAREENVTITSQIYYTTLIKVEAHSDQPDKAYVKTIAGTSDFTGRAMFFPSADVETWTDGFWNATIEFNSSASSDYLGLLVDTSDNRNVQVFEVGYATNPITELTLNGMNLAVGETQALSYTTAPERALPGILNIESSNPAVAAVEGGAIVGKSEGRATITVSTGDIRSTAIVNVGGKAATESFAYPDGTKLSDIDNLTDTATGFNSQYPGWKVEMTDEQNQPVNEEAAAPTVTGNVATFRNRGSDSRVDTKATRALAEPINFAADGRYEFGYNLEYNEWWGDPGMGTSFVVGDAFSVKTQVRTDNGSCRRVQLFQGGSMIAQTDTELPFAENVMFYYKVTLTTSATGADKIHVDIYQTPSVPSASATPVASVEGEITSDAVANAIGFTSQIYLANASARIANLSVKSDLPLLTQTDFAVADGVYSSTVTNNTAEAVDVQLIAAKYAADGSVTVYPAAATTVEAGASQTLSSEAITLANGDTVKLFVWNRVEGMTPIFQTFAADSNGWI